MLARTVALVLAAAAPTAARGAGPADLQPLVQPADPPPDASGASGAIDPEAATSAYLATVPPGARARSDAYFEGGYWLDLLGFLWTVASMLLLFAAYGFLLTPVTNSMVRVTEQEADYYGLNAARRPDGQAQIALRMAEYRKLAPGRLEEIVFYDHPSGRTRILTAMRWKAEHPETWTAPAGVAPR